jgi:hypothetical protein
MSFEFEELRKAIAVERGILKEKAGSDVRYTTVGPVSLRVIDALVRVLEVQAREIDDLKRKVGMGNG